MKLFSRDFKTLTSHWPFCGDLEPLRHLSARHVGIRKLMGKCVQKLSMTLNAKILNNEISFKKAIEELHKGIKYIKNNYTTNRIIGLSIIYS